MQLKPPLPVGFSCGLLVRLGHTLQREGGFYQEGPRGSPEFQPSRQVRVISGHPQRCSAGLGVGHAASPHPYLQGTSRPEPSPSCAAGPDSEEAWLGSGWNPPSRPRPYKLTPSSVQTLPPAARKHPPPGERPLPRTQIATVAWGEATRLASRPPVSPVSLPTCSGPSLSPKFAGQVGPSCLPSRSQAPLLAQTSGPQGLLQWGPLLTSRPKLLHLNLSPITVWTRT